MPDYGLLPCKPHRLAIMTARTRSRAAAGRGSLARGLPSRASAPTASRLYLRFSV